MMDLDELPHHLVIVGGGAIGIEFAQMFRRFGSEVTIVEATPRLVANEDEDVSAAIHGTFEREGIAIRLNAKCIAFSKRGEETVANVDCTDGTPEVIGSHVLRRRRQPN
jgi:pyruvate/2-oxoglutarate dehydrogenase complex dihydrolipoamide dehydrogenase (E3) component